MLYCNTTSFKNFTITLNHEFVKVSCTLILYNIWDTVGSAAEAMALTLFIRRH